MQSLVLLLAILSIFAGGAFLYVAESAIHEIEAFILFTISAILICGFGIMNHIEKLQDSLKFKIDYAIKRIKEK